MPFKADAIANEFLGKSFADEDACLVDPMKAQKLTYFAHGYYLAITDAPLVGEYFQAWKLGPVLPSLYRSLKVFGSEDIDSYIPMPTLFVRRNERAELRQDQNFTRVLDFVWNTYKNLSAMALSRLTHKRDYAWNRTIEKNPGILGPPMRNEDILTDFAPLVRRDGRITAHT